MDLATQSLFKDLLLKRLQNLYLEAERTAAGLTDTENFPDPIDRANADWEKNFMLSMRERERKLIIEIHEALHRIEEGDFGECEECGDDIGIQRLKSMPEATLCVECKRKQESKKR